MNKILVTITALLLLTCFTACSSAAETPEKETQSKSTIEFAAGDNCNWYCKNCKLCIKSAYDRPNCPSCGKPRAEVE